MTVLSFATLAVFVSRVAAAGNSTSTADSGELPVLGSGNGTWESTYDDEDEGTEYLNYDDDDYESKNDGGEWNGFDGVVCGTGYRVGKGKVCNGIPDCYDCSDEEDCPNSAERIFFCHEKESVPFSRDYTLHNPKCIVMERFCDGMRDCENGKDEKRFGTGFKCMIKDKFRKCILPENLVCDDDPNCEDQSDLCTNEQAMTTSNITSDTGMRYSQPPDGFFRCLNSELLISLKQVCDGEFDCQDLSDECLCEVYKSEVVEQVCGGLCAKPLWTDQPKNGNCDVCSQGEVLWPTASNHSTNSDKSVRRDCLSAKEVIQLLETGERSARSISLQMQEYDVIECLDKKLTTTVRARKCDGRPECFFGEDECGIDCKGGGNKEWEIGSGGWDNSSDPEFCRLLASDLSRFSCLLSLNDDRTRKTNFTRLEKIYNEHLIEVCDGAIECLDGSDESYCPKRISCAEGENDTSVGTIDEAQRCDGFKHCANGKDERPSICSHSTTLLLPCDNVGEETFSTKSLLDGRKDCSTGADECPPFLSRIPYVKAKMYEGTLGESDQVGISSHSKAVDNLALQIFLIACALIGISALAVSLVLAFYNLIVVWARFCKSGVKERTVWIHNSVIYARELVVNSGMTVSKGLVCGYFAYIKIERQDDANYGNVDLKWRASASCSLAGAIVMIGTQVPIFTLAVFAGSYILWKRCVSTKGRHCKVKRSQDNGLDRKESSARGNIDGGPRNAKTIGMKALLGVFCFLLLTLIWLPIVLVAALLTYASPLNERTQTYGWISPASPIFRANLLGRESAAEFASIVFAIRNHTIDSSELNHFTFPEFVRIVDSTAPSLGVKFLGSYGYFAHSGSCLPGFLVHLNGGKAPFDIAVSNSWTWGVSLALIIVDSLLIIFTVVLVTRYGAGICKISCRGPQYNHRDTPSQRVLNHTFSRFVLVEVVTWVLLIVLFFVKTGVGDAFSDYAYTVCCLVVLGLNCGLIAPFVLLKRKFRLQKNADPSTIKVRSQTITESVEIVEIKEENKTEEKKSLTNEKTESVKEEEPQNEEIRRLVEDDGAGKEKESD